MSKTIEERPPMTHELTTKLRELGARMVHIIGCDSYQGPTYVDMGDTQVPLPNSSPPCSCGLDDLLDRCIALSMAAGGPLVEAGEHPAALSGEQVEKVMEAVVSWDSVRLCEPPAVTDEDLRHMWNDLRQRLTSLSTR